MTDLWTYLVTILLLTMLMTYTTRKVLGCTIWTKGQKVQTERFFVCQDSQLGHTYIVA